MNDKGHQQLIQDIEGLLAEASLYEFHDFKNNKYATPKVELVNKLNDIATKVKNGAYDNESL